MKRFLKLVARIREANHLKCTSALPTDAGPAICKLDADERQKSPQADRVESGGSGWRFMLEVYAGG